jgi:hypothetical protein
MIGQRWAYSAHASGSQGFRGRPPQAACRMRNDRKDGYSLAPPKMNSGRSHGPSGSIMPLATTALYIPFSFPASYCVPQTLRV